MQIHALLPLYPDDEGRRQLLTQAIAQTRADVTALRLARTEQNQDAALQALHRAKGTASFLGGDEAALRHFDELTRLIQTRLTAKGRGKNAGGDRLNRRDAHPPLSDAAVLAAYVRVEGVLLELESVLCRLLDPEPQHPNIPTS